MNIRRILTRIKNSRLIKFILEIPEALFAGALILLVLTVLYYFEKPEGFIHAQFPGLILDIAVFGILIVVFNRVSGRRREIQGYRDEINDFLPWAEPEATYRITGIIKRLNRLGISNIYLAQAQNLKEADLREVHLEGAALWGAHLEGAVLGGAHLEGANLRMAHLERAVLWEAHLERADLGKAHLEKAALWMADLLDVINITLKQISMTKSLYEVKNLNTELWRQIQEIFPHLLKMPEDEDEEI